jgi:hypothetical protein
MDTTEAARGRATTWQRAWEELDIEALVATFKLSRKRAVIVR